MNNKKNENENEDGEELIVTIDKYGRFVIPEKLRKKFDSKIFYIKQEDNTLKLIPVPIPSLKELEKSNEKNKK